GRRSSRKIILEHLSQVFKYKHEGAREVVLPPGVWWGGVGAGRSQSLTARLTSPSSRNDPCSPAPKRKTSGGVNISSLENTREGSWGSEGAGLEKRGCWRTSGRAHRLPTVGVDLLASKVSATGESPERRQPP
ncbi:unnamed protein product, partial [Scytosiphon promiscuus]